MPGPDLAIKTPCLVATTSNITLSGLQTIDGVALAAGNRVLVWQQTVQTANGIYDVSSGAWGRSVDIDSNAEIASGMLVTVTAGTTYAKAVFYLATPDPISIGSSALVFVRFGAYVNVQDYGAIPNGPTSDATANANAFLAAVAALPASGGGIIIPSGRYYTNGPLANLANRRSIEFIGVGSGNGQTDPNIGSQVVYINDTGPLIRLDGTQAISFRRLTLNYSSPTYALNNAFIDLHATTPGSDTAGTLFEECEIAGWNTSAKNALLMDIHNSTETTIRLGYIHNAHFGIVGAKQASQTDFCNDVTIDGVKFDASLGVPIIAGGAGWTISNVVSEPTSGTAGGAGLTFLTGSPWGVYSLSLFRCNFLDGQNNSGAWIDFGSATDYGAQGPVGALTCIGSTFQCGSNAGAGFAFNFGTAGVKGGAITGCLFNKQVNDGFIYNGAGASSISIIGNYTSTSGGPGAGKVFVLGGYPTGASQYDDNDGKGIQFSTPIGAGSGGTGNSGGAWTVSNPVPSSSVGGAFTSASSTVAFVKEGKKIFCEGVITITTVGSASGAITLQLPFTLVRRITFGGKEVAISGIMFGADVQTNGLLTLLKYDNASYIVAGAQFPFSFTAEAA